VISLAEVLGVRWSKLYQGTGLRLSRKIIWLEDRLDLSVKDFVLPFEAFCSKEVSSLSYVFLNSSLDMATNLLLEEDCSQKSKYTVCLG